MLRCASYACTSMRTAVLPEGGLAALLGLTLIVMDNQALLGLERMVQGGRILRLSESGLLSALPHTQSAPHTWQLNCPNAMPLSCYSHLHPVST